MLKQLHVLTGKVTVICGLLKLRRQLHVMDSKSEVITDVVLHSEIKVFEADATVTISVKLTDTHNTVVN